MRPYCLRSSPFRVLIRKGDGLRKMVFRGRYFGGRGGRKCNMLWFFFGLFVTYHLYQTLTMPVRFLFTNPYVDSQCIIPDLDPYDKSVMKYIWHPDPIVCDKTPSLMYVDWDGQTNYNETALKYFGHARSDYECVYNVLSRVENDDYHVRLASGVPFTPPKIIPADFFRVTCKVGFKVVYDNLHESVYAEPVLSNRNINEEAEGRYSVLMFGLDSTSRLNAIRKLPKTMSYLTEQLGALTYKGYMKVADNTFPNLIPVLTGRKAWSDELPILASDYKRSQIDSFPFLWKNFSRAKYATYLAEDYPDLSSFVTETLGFKDQPTDHYYRPYLLGIKKVDFVQTVLDSVLLPFEYKNLNLQKHSSLCFGNTPRHKLMIQYYQRFVRMYSGRLKFGLSWISEICHEFINYLEIGDNDMYEFVKFLNDNGHLKNSFLIFFSDHGSRLDDIRNTFVGRIEERMPLLSIVVPKPFRDKYPQVYKTMQENTDKLASNFDLYETVAQLLEGNFDTKLRFTGRSKRGISLMQPIPATRSCADAEIPEHYCACYKSTDVSPENKQVRDVVEFVVHELHILLAKYKDICADLKLVKVHHSELISLGLYHAGDELNRWTLYKLFSNPEKEKNKRFMVVFETLPGNAMFEATVDYNVGKPMKLLGDVSRVNKYGNQSICVPEKRLRRYCYCKSLLTQG